MTILKLPISRTAVLGLLFSAAVAALPLRAQTPTFTNVTVHDPSVVKDGSSYYVFGSHMASASTTNLLNWTQISTGPTAPNSLINGGNPQTEFAAALSYAQATTFWAPDVIKLGDGKYYFYYCACKGDSPLSALGIAKADSITGPYSNVGIILKSLGASPTVTPYNAATMPNVVDPSVFYDKTGRLWMVYGSFSGGIFILELNTTTGQPLVANSYGKKLIGGNHARIEGAYIIYSPETLKYYLFMTFGGLDAVGGYNIRVARSDNPDGPFLDAGGNDITGVTGSITDDTLIAPYGVKLMGNWQFLHDASEPRTVSKGYVSPGGCSVNRDSTTGKYMLVFHTRFVGSGEVHEVRAHQLYLNADGWFVAAPQRYAQETISTTVASQIPGSYKLINHGKDVTATVKTSSVITLAGSGSSGTITGASTGTWALSSDHDATLVISGTTYRGVFSKQWDDDNQVWTQTFSALSINGSATPGVAVWGTKIIPGNTVSQAVTTNHSVSFTATGTSGSIQWQIFPAGGTAWQNLANDSTYSGVSTTTLTIASATSTLDGAKYRYITTATGGGTTGVPVTLAVGAAVLAKPVSLVIDSSGNIYVADETNHTIGKITSGTFSVLAGTTGSLGSTDGTGTAALFRAPAGIALDSANNLYVADTGNSTIRKITSTGVVTTLAGNAGSAGSTNGTGTAARFSSPADVTSTAAGALYVADTGNHTVRQIDTAAAVTTLAGSAGTSGNADGTGSAARFNALAGIAVAATGDLYIGDTGNNTLRKSTSAGVTTTVAGTFGVTGSTDGTGLSALFNGLTGTAVDSSGNIYVADTQNSTIRKITSGGVVTTVAGLAGISGLKDGTGTDAWFDKPRDVTVDSSGNLYVADTGNAAIRKITPAGVVTTLSISATSSSSSGSSSGSTSSSSSGASSSSSGAAGGGGGGGGGGGAPSLYYFAALLALGVLRRFIRS